MIALVRGVGIVVALTIMVVSGVMNARYAASIATTMMDGYLLAAGAIFADVSKALAWIFFAEGLARRQVVQATTSMLIFVLCLGVAVSGSIGFVATQRATTTGLAAIKTQTLRSLQDEMTRKTARLTSLAVVDTEAVVFAIIEQAKQHWLYTRSKLCSAADTTDSRAHCSAIKGLERDLATAREAARLDSDITALRERIAHFGPTTSHDNGDTQSGLIAKMTGWPLEAVQLWQQVLFVAMIEAGACLMLNAAMTYGRMPSAKNSDQVQLPPATSGIASVANHDMARLVATGSDIDHTISLQIESSVVPATKLAAPALSQGQAAVMPLSTLTTVANGADPMIGHLDQFLKAMCDRVSDDAGLIELQALLTQCREWCAAHAYDPQDNAMLLLGLRAACQQAGLKWRRYDGQVYVLGIDLKSTSNGVHNPQRS